MSIVNFVMTLPAVLFVDNFGRKPLLAWGEANGDTFKIGASNPSAFINGGDHGDTIDYSGFGVAVFAKNNGTTKSGPRYDLDSRNQLIHPTVETIKGTPFGLIYADKASASDIALDEKELALLKTLRNQAVMAFRQARP